MVVQWIEIHLPMQGTRIRSQVWEESTCHGAIKSVCHNHWACMPQLLKPMHPRATQQNYWVPRLQFLKPEHLETVLSNKRSPCTTTKSNSHMLQLEKAPAQQGRPSARINFFKKENNLKNRKIIHEQKSINMIDGHLHLTRESQKAGEWHIQCT